MRTVPDHEAFQPTQGDVIRASKYLADQDLARVRSTLWWTNFAEWLAKETDIPFKEALMLSFQASLLKPMSDREQFLFRLKVHWDVFLGRIQFSQPSGVAVNRSESVTFQTIDLFGGRYD